MKTIKKFSLICLPILLSLGTNFTELKVEATSNYVVSTDGCSSGKLPTKLDLNSVSEEEIREYYSSLNSLDSSERSGIGSLQYIKPILFEMNYFTYDQVGDIYAITDRDWANSPTLTSGTYDSSTNTVSNFSSSAEADSNPYITMLYVDYSDGVKTPHTDESGKANFDKEHVWCQSRGFKASSGAKGPAGTDLHHLIAGDSYVNESVHNNNPYGFVNVSSKTGNLSYTASNLKGSQKHTSENDQADTVFEPMDEWKGDIARAIFYMMARYNNISGTETISQFEPNLTIVNYATSNGNAEESSATSPVAMGIISDLLAWNKLDPVSDFEIYRNDLIYRNYQGNRNPFIDFPQWIDAIWGTADLDGTNYSNTPVGVIDPSNDVINGQSNYLSVSSSNITFALNETHEIKAKSSSSNDISWSISDSTIASIDKTSTKSGDSVTITALKEGSTIIVVSTEIDGTSYSKTIQVTVKTCTSEDAEIPTPIIVIGCIVAIVFALSSMYKKSKKKNKKSTYSTNAKAKTTKKSTSTKKKK